MSACPHIYIHLPNTFYDQLLHAKRTGSMVALTDTCTAGLLEQWLIEGNFTEEEALMQSSDMMAVGIDTVRKSSLSHYMIVYKRRN